MNEENVETVNDEIKIEEKIEAEPEKKSKEPFFKRMGRHIAYFFKVSPIWCKVFWCLAVISGIIHIISCFSVKFSDFFVRYPGAWFRFIVSKATTWIPFSLAEMLVMLIPLIVVFLIILGIVVIKKNDSKNYCRLIAVMLAIIAYFYFAFVFSIAPGYKGSTLDVKLGIQTHPLTSDDLYQTAEYLNNEINKDIDSIGFITSDKSVMPYSLDEMNEKLNDAYEKAVKKYTFINNFRTNVKYVILSEPWSYTHITGIYTYFTGEANINVNFPDYTIPYTAAHELAHQRGIAKENEANFVAYLICIESDDPYIRYSANANMLEYVMSALYSANSSKYNKMYKNFDNRLVGEFYSYARFFEKYRENKVEKISEKINNNYLHSQGVTEGTRSYGLVVDLMVAYYERTIEE
ncbi:MAG: DUF3810 domain-containing protein [Clostridia bacterium]|nr:DUF3810 domain-containing protein [Clostridia bacterium]